MKLFSLVFFRCTTWGKSGASLGRNYRGQTIWDKCQDRKGTPKNFSDKEFAELSGELSGEICLKTVVLVDSALELFRQFFGAVRAIF